MAQPNELEFDLKRVVRGEVRFDAYSLWLLLSERRTLPGTPPLRLRPRLIRAVL